MVHGAWEDDGVQGGMRARARVSIFGRPLTTAPCEGDKGPSMILMGCGQFCPARFPARASMRHPPCAPSARVCRADESQEAWPARACCRAALLFFFGDCTGQFFVDVQRGAHPRERAPAPLLPATAPQLVGARREVAPGELQHDGRGGDRQHRRAAATRVHGVLRVPHAHAPGTTPGPTVVLGRSPYFCFSFGGGGEARPVGQHGVDLVVFVVFVVFTKHTARRSVRFVVAAARSWEAKSCTRATLHEWG